MGSKGIILAAGRGSRMGGLTDELPKCRVSLHGKALIEWQLAAMAGAEIDDVAIVRGYLGETFDYETHYFDNPRWADSNMLTSLLSAREWLENYTCVVSYSDIVYSADAVRRLEEAEGDICITYDPNWLTLWQARFDNPLEDAESFVLDGDQVVDIGRRVDDVARIQGQFMGLLKFTPEGWRQVAEHVAELPFERVDRTDMTRLLSELIARGVEVSAIPIADRWYEVDRGEDLSTYQRMPPVATR